MHWGVIRHSISKIQGRGGAIGRPVLLQQPVVQRYQAGQEYGRGQQ